MWKRPFCLSYKVVKPLYRAHGVEYGIVWNGMERNESRSGVVSAFFKLPTSLVRTRMAFHRVYPWICVRALFPLIFRNLLHRIFFRINSMWWQQLDSSYEATESFYVSPRPFRGGNIQMNNAKERNKQKGTTNSKLVWNEQSDAVIRFTAVVWSINIFLFVNFH